MIEQRIESAGHMAFRELQQGIDAIQRGSHEEGARLLRIGLKKTDLPPHIRAVALMWLAETQPDLDDKITTYERARQADPNNPDVVGTLARLLEQRRQQRQHMQRQLDDEAIRQNTQENPSEPIFYTPPPTPPDPNRMGDSGRYSPQGDSQWLRTPENQPTEMNPTDWLTRPQQGMDGSQQPQPPYRPSPQDPRSNYGGNPRPNEPDPAAPQGYDPSVFNHPGYDHQAPDYRQRNGGQWQQPHNAPWQGDAPQGNMGPTAYPPDPRHFDTGQLQAQTAFDQQRQQHANQPQRTLHLQGLQRCVAVRGGPNGRGTGFFVSSDGLLATTRFAVGGETHLRVELGDGQAVTGTVVRSFPDYDLALLQTDVILHQLYSITPLPTIADNTPIFVVTHNGQAVMTQKRGTRHQTQPHWFPTLIDQFTEAGGNPIVDDRNLLLGMLTRNARRSTPYFYGLHISKIYDCVAQYTEEKKFHLGAAAYCYACGMMSRAPAYGGYYCENCGEVLPYAEHIRRTPQPNLVSLYRENTQLPCVNCHSPVGYYGGACLRCGYRPSSKN